MTRAISSYEIEQTDDHRSILWRALLRVQLRALQARGWPQGEASLLTNRPLGTNSADIVHVEVRVALRGDALDAYALPRGEDAHCTYRVPYWHLERAVLVVPDELPTLVLAFERLAEEPS